MDRTHKRCLAASVALHGVLLGIVLFGSAFFPSRRVEERIPVLTFIPAIATDGQFVGGGNRSAGTPAPASPVSRPQTQAPALRQPDPPRPAPARNPVREAEPARQANNRATPPAVENRSRPRVQLPESALRPVERGAKKSASRTPPRTTSTDTRRSNATSNSSASSGRSQLASRIQDSMNRIGSGTAGGTSVDMPGDGSGGPSYAPYAAIIKTIYDRAWVSPEDLHDDGAVVDVEIEVARDGTVLTGRIIKRSGNARMDRSVQDVLNRVDFIKEFPASWPEQRRTFQIRFDLKLKEQLLG